MSSDIDSVVFPHLEADLDRVRDVLGPARLPSRNILTGLTDEAPDGSRRMVRPTLTLQSYYLLTDPAVPARDRVVRAAAAVELLHLGSLYHDDVIDHAYQRRGRPSANAVWGSHLAVLGGDSVTFAGARILAELGQREVLAAMTVGEQMCEGMMIEAADLYGASRTEQSYLDGIDGKTAALLSLACRVGAMQTGRDEADEQALAMFGRQFGMAYQLFDDILDLTSTAAEMGKPVNSDLPEGIYTLPVIRAAARDGDLARLLRRTMTGEEAARARELVIASGAVDEARTLADTFMDRADGHLAALRAHPGARRAMSAYTRSVLDRRPALLVIPAPAKQPSTAPDYIVPQEITHWVRNWMMDTGLVLSPDELDRDHRWTGVLRLQSNRIMPAANTTRVQTTAGLALLSLVWDDLFDDPRLTDPQAVTALRHGLVAMLRQDPQIRGAIPAAWAGLWPRVREGRSARWQERFLDNLEQWFEAAEREAHHRITGYVPSTADYVPLRKSTSGIETIIAGVEVHQDRELPSRLRDHPVIRRLEELLFLVGSVENDLVGLARDEADRAPYNLVRAVCRETGCTREEAVEQVGRQLAEYRAQLDSVIRYVPALLRMIPGLSGRRKEIAAMYANMTEVLVRVNQSERHTHDSASPALDLERLRSEIYRGADESAPAAP
ncbi:polyprenyl synthetase family protein [Nocardia alni]|uniref:polyprenyl synthetase family protein n=1 Tax=Nocardia alni TaxID=2815723 RepID=UPI001C21752D|nr:polyprenyl synthetase family protein [Nocardia alni]